MSFNRYDSLSEILTKNEKKPFSGNPEERAYLEGLRCGDIYAQKHGRSIRVSVGTTHRAMLSLFEKLFSKYSKVGFYPKYDSRMEHHVWTAYCDLNPSFEFLLNKAMGVPSWVCRSDRLFFEFLSGYFDADGCLSICVDSKGCKNVQFILKSCNKQILDDIICKISYFGFELNSKLAKKADTAKISNRIRYRHDYWYTGTGRKQQVLDLLDIMPLRHEEKIARSNMLKELESSNWKDASKKIVELRNAIKLDVQNCVESARLNMMIRKNCN